MSCKPNPDAAMDPRNAEHPCYSEAAHHFFARMHLAVAPGCNIACNYCNRKYDCANESRPGVVSDRLTPEEALKKVYKVAESVKELSVVGIAGPGDALASPQRTFKTLEMIREHFPDLKLCLSTNGLNLSKYASRLAQLGVDHVTVTLNTFDPKTALKIYAWIKYKGKKENSLEAAANFIVKQQEGIKALVNLGVLVKVNSLLMPGINDQELPLVSKKLKLMGVFMHNIMPLIAKAEHGTRFGLEGRPEPTPEELETVREACGDIKQMAHCRQCRADAVGKLGEDQFANFSKENYQEMEIPESNFFEKRELWRNRVAFQAAQKKTGVMLPTGPKVKIALCSQSMGVVDQHFGHAKGFYIYQVEDGVARLLNYRQLSTAYCDGEDSCGDKETVLTQILSLLEGCQAVVSLKVGYPIFKKLSAEGILPVVNLAGRPLAEAAVEAAELVLQRGQLDQQNNRKEKSQEVV